MQLLRLGWGLGVGLHNTVCDRITIHFILDVFKKKKEVL